MYNIQFGIPMKPVRLIDMYLNETYSRVWVGKHLSDMFPTESDLKQADALSQVIFNVLLEYAFRTVKQTGRT